MSFWKDLYNGGKEVLRYIAEPALGIKQTQKDTGKNLREEPLRKLGDGGIAVDDFIKRASGQQSYYDRKAEEENDRYWADYFKNTGIDPESAKYPIRMGIDNNSPNLTMPGMAMTTGKRAINMLYGKQE